MKSIFVKSLQEPPRRGRPEKWPPKFKRVEKRHALRLDGKEGANARRALLRQQSKGAFTGLNARMVNGVAYIFRSARNIIRSGVGIHE